MRDDLMGGLLATAVAAPVLIVCCGGGAAVLAGLAGAFGGWLSGLNWIAVAVAAAGAALAWRTLHRRKNSGAFCVSPARSETDQHG
jgi:membrane protein implicated in regulation of membrane protease activity